MNEGGDGRTSYTLSKDLQPTTRYFWRVRIKQGSTTSAFSTAFKFRSKIVGYKSSR